MRVKPVELSFSWAPGVCAAEYEWGTYAAGSEVDLGVKLPPMLSRAVARRKAAFLAGRHCAQRAMVAAGFAQPLQLPIGVHQCPAWPKGWVGSITHTDAFAAAVLRQSSQVWGVGLDVEPVISMTRCRRIGPMVVNPEELSICRARERWAEDMGVTFAFSAKESVFKALFAQVGRYFEFHAVAITEVDVDHGRFRFRTRRSLCASIPGGWEAGGHFALIDQGVFTFVEHVRAHGSKS